MYHISIKESKENQSLDEYKATRSTSSPLTPEKLNIWFPQCRSFTWSACPYVKIKPSQTAVLYRSFGQKFWGSFSQLVRKLFYEHWGPSKEYHLRNKELQLFKKNFFFFLYFNYPLFSNALSFSALSSRPTSAYVTQEILLLSQIPIKAFSSVILCVFLLAPLPVSARVSWIGLFLLWCNSESLTPSWCHDFSHRCMKACCQRRACVRLRSSPSKACQTGIWLPTHFNLIVFTHEYEQCAKGDSA